MKPKTPPAETPTFVLCALVWLIVGSFFHLRVSTETRNLVRTHCAAADGGR